MVMGATSGRVRNVTLPRLSPRIWEMKSSRFQPLSVIRYCLATDSRSVSLVRSPSTPSLRERLGDRVHDRLLALGAVEVAVGQAVPLAHEGQRHLRAEALVAGVLGGEARVRVVRDRVGEADLYAADDLGQLVEAVQVQLGEVVDTHPGERLDGLHFGRPARLVALVGELVLADAGVLRLGLVLRGGQGEAVGLVDLALGIARSRQWGR